MAGGMRPRDGASGRRVARGRARRFYLESLEDRTAPAVWNIASGVAADLIAAINDANTNGDASNTINLAGTYTLAVADHDGFGPTGLPAITSNLAIIGSSTAPAAIVRSAAAGTPGFRLLEVGGGYLGDSYGTLTLRNLTLANGVAQGEGSGTGGGGLGAGGAIFNMGSLTLDGATITGNRAIGGSGSGATGGNSGGSLSATGSESLASFGVGGDGNGGDGMGGALFNFTGSLTVINSTIAGNEARGGSAGAGGSAGEGHGGGILNLNGSVILVNATLGENDADTDGLDLSSLAYGREWRTGDGLTPGGPVTAAVSMAGSLLASSGAGRSALVSRVDGSSWSTGAGGDDAATIDAAMVGGSTPSSAVRGVSGSFASGSVETASIPILDPAGLASHGGPTQTIAVTGSRLAGIAPGTAVFGLSVPAIDQRGATRPAAGGDAGAFQVTAPPTAALTSAPPANAAMSAASTTVVVVTYADQSGLGLDPSTFGIGNIAVTNGATVTGFSVAGTTVTYTIAAPTAGGITWGDAPQGAYDVSIVAGSVRDLAGGSIAAGVLGSFLVDVVPPTATLNSAPTLNGSSGGLNTETLMVIFTDRGAGIDPSSLGTGNLTVSNGATVTGVSASGGNVYYIVTAPASTWASSPQGRYYVSLAAGSVKDLAGNPIVGVSSFGTFMVDTVAPTATLTAAPAVNAATSGKTTTVTVTYSDAASGVSPPTFSKSNITVNNGATVTGFSPAGNVVTYTITAPASTWGASPQGPYIISLATTVKDFAGNAIAAVASLGSFTVDTIAPTATLASAPAVNAATAGKTTTVAVTYDGGGSGLSAGSLGTGNITVGNGATVTGFSVSGNTVTYTVTAPMATWADSPQGGYTIAVVAAGVKDGAGNPIAAVASLGTFLVDTTPPTAALSSAPTINAADAGLATTTVAVTYDGGASGLDATTFGVGNVAIGNGATVTAYSVAGSVVTYTVNAPAASWAASPQGDYSVTLVAGSVKDGAGNPIAGPLLLGSFQVASATVTASLVAAPTVNSASAAESTTTVTIAYGGGSSGLDPASLGTGNLSVSRGATVAGFSASGDVVTYTIAAPGSTWSNSPQGSYAISIVAGSVKAIDGSAIPGNPSFASFLVDTVAPAASLSSLPAVNATGAADGTTTLSVTYADETSGIDAATFGIGNITVSRGATVTGYSASGNVVTYTIAAPASSWAASPQGSYAISLVAGEVKDLAGDSVAAAGLGSFMVDTVAPSASLTAAPTVNAASAASGTTTIAVTYDDATSGLDTATFGAGNITVSHGATVTGFSASGNVVTYTVAAPAASWAVSPQGSYAISLVAGSVKDLAGNSVVAASLGSFFIDTVAPTASLSPSPPVNATGAAHGTTTLSVTYADETSGLDASSLGLGNITVSRGATVTGYSASGDVVTYTITAPGTNWGASPQGSYAIALVAGSVKDLAGNSVAAASLGSFLVDTVAPSASLIAAPTVNATSAASGTTTITVTYADAIAGLDPATFGVGNITVDHGATVTGYSASGNVVTYTITAPATNWGTSPQDSYAISLVAGTVKDLAGNAVAAASLGSFLVDTAPPSAVLSSSLTVNATSAASGTTTIAVTYDDATSGLDTATFGVGNITVSRGAAVTGYSASGNVVTYTVAAPASSWAASAQGSYAISLVAGSVKDLAGNSVAAAGLGSFLVDTVAPSASLTAAPTVNAASAASGTTTIAVTYADATSGLDASSFGLGNITVNRGAAVTGYSASGNVVTYTVAAPASSWAASPQGSYAIALVAGSVKDLAGNSVAAAGLGSFFIDTVAPTASLSPSPPVNATGAAHGTTTVAVNYADATSGLDASSLGLGNITVSRGATVTGYSASGDVVTYTITAPGTNWGASPQGSYAIALVAGSVKDLAGNAVAAASLGSFLVDTAPPSAVLSSSLTVNATSAASGTTTIAVTYDDAIAGLDPATFGVGNITVSRGATVTGYSASGNVVTYTITAPGTNWGASPQGSYAIALVAGSVKDLAGNAVAAASLGSFLVDTAPPSAVLSSSLTVNATSAASGTTTIAVTYDDATSGLDTATFGVGNITVSRGAAVTGYSASGNVVTYTVAAPASSWAASAQGSYAISLVAGSVKDLAGNSVAAAGLGSFLVDTVAPSASLIAAPTVNATASTNTTVVTITYTDATSGIDPSSLGPANLAVGNGATVLGYSVAGNAVSYTIRASSTTWASSPQGAYAIALIAGSVKDLAGNVMAGVSSLGSFVVDAIAPAAVLVSAAGVGIEAAGTSTTKVTVRYADATAGVDPTTFGAGNIAVGHGATVSGYSVSGNVVTYTIHAPGASWAAGPEGSYAISIVAGSVKDLAGNPIAGDPALGSFAVDLTRLSATTTLAIAPGAATFGQSVRLTATVSAASGASRPGGTVVFREGAVTLAQAAVGPDGTASATLASGLGVGSHAIVASYAGDPLFAPADSAASTLVVGKAAATSSALTSSATSVYQGQGVTLAATFQAGSDGATPMTGTVAFYDGATYLGTAAIGPTISGSTATARASFATAPLAAGAHAFHAVYSGDASYAAASADAATVTANPATTSVSLTVATSAQSATLSASVAVTSPGQVALAGMVNFYDNGSLVGSAGLSGGSASLMLANLAAGAHAFAAAYAGATGIAGGSSAAVGASIVAPTPNVISIAIQSVKRKPPVVVITFDRAVDTAVAATAARYVVIGPIVGKKPGKPIRVLAASYAASSHAVTLTFKAKLTAAKSYRLTIADIGFTAVFKGKGIVGR
ncbi:Ig-like domain-containing protein [Aquisphaera insulae]|uniref:Ig-like domain-containing protein n=1 Tax=Aquisphaera insulae TaxID=2712864 RepID=UPI0013EAA015|nr:Ig-like domain-containing protein [Aquisphaera insulae]